MRSKRGSALLTVLWACAAMAAIALAVANTVRGEAERAATSSESMRAYYLAAGAVDRALLWVEWGLNGATNRDGTPRFYHPPMPLLRMEFPEGEAVVEMIPEVSKLDINRATREELARLIAAAGAPEQAMDLSAAILDWRSGGPDGQGGVFDDWYATRQPSFRPPHASFQEIEELLLVRGMTPELFYGGYRHNDEGSPLPFGGLRDCLSVYGSLGPFDINTVRPQLLQALGIPPDGVAAILDRRSRGVIKNVGDLGRISGEEGASRLGVADANSGTIWTLRATARARLASGQLSPVQHSTSAMVKFLKFGESIPPWQIMRWYDDSPRMDSPLPGSGADSFQQVTPLE